MNSSPVKTGLVMLAVVVLSAAGGYWLAMTRADSAGVDSRKALYWYDPMVPTQHFDQPGKSPFMDMQLVPKYADADAQSSAPAGVQIDSQVVQNLGLRLASVARGVVSPVINAAGTIGFNQRQVAIVQTRSSGFVTRVYQRAPGDVIASHAPLVDLLVPEWAGAQTEFIALLKSNDDALIAAARQRLLLLGMSSELIARVEHSQQPQTTFTINTPIAGVIESLDVRTGMSLSADATVAKINGIDTVWLEAAVPEAQAGFIKSGMPVTAQLAAYPGEQFNGRVLALLPETSVATHTLRIRIELPNLTQRLKPGMFAQVNFATGDSQPVLLVPSEAVIRSGVRNVVIVAEAAHFRPAEVQLGQESAGKTIILAGLSEGEKIVISGQFLIDSEASLQGVLTRMNGNTP